MPYNRYDIKNKYNRRGRRVNERIWVYVLLLILIPLLIAGVVIFGIIMPFLRNNNNSDSKTNTTSATVSVKEDESSADNEQLLHIVSEKYPLEADDKPSLLPFGNVSVAQVAFDDLDDLISAAKAEGINISVQKGYVSFEEQEKLYSETFAKLKADNDYSEIKAESETKKICPKAGCSESQTGLLLQFATDEEGDFFNTEAGIWLTKYCVNYGFILRYPEGEEDVTGRTYDASLYRYVGIDNAKKMRSYGMTLEAYSVHISQQSIP